MARDRSSNAGRSLTRRNESAYRCHGPEPRRLGGQLVGLPGITEQRFDLLDFYVSSQSTEPTLVPGDSALVNPVACRPEPAHAGDFVVFRLSPNDTTPGMDDLIKRVALACHEPNDLYLWAHGWLRWHHGRHPASDLGRVDKELRYAQNVDSGKDRLTKDG